MPGWAIDLIRDGVPLADLRERGQRAVWDALGRTALAAVNAGHSRVEWECEVVHPASKLGIQNRLDANGKERSKQAANKALNSAWARAEKVAVEHPAWSQETAREEAQQRARVMHVVVADPDINLTDAQRTLLIYAADKAADLGSVSVNLPRDMTAQETGLGQKAVRIHLDRLATMGFLILSEHGRARTKSRPGRANAYRLPEADKLHLAVTSLSRETRQVGPTPQTGRPPAQSPTGPAPGPGAHLPPAVPLTIPEKDLERRPRPGELRQFAQRGAEQLLKWALEQAAATPPTQTVAPN